MRKYVINIFILLSSLGLIWKSQEDAKKIEKERIETQLKTELMYQHKLDSISKVNQKKLDSLHLQMTQERLDCSMNIQKAYKMIGTPYKWGGISRSGVDCSGLICLVAAKKRSKTLLRLRTAANMFSKLKMLTSPKKGALVFFNMRKGVDHVGLVVGKDKFIHSSSSRGVVVANLSSFKNQIRGYREI